MEDSDTQRQTQTAAAPETKTDKVLTVEERIILDRRAVTEWLYNAGKVGTPPIKRLIGDLLSEIEMDTQALNTPAHIENVLLEYEKMIADNPDDERALNAADKLLDLAGNYEVTDKETSEKMVNLAINLQNPNDEITVSELSGNRLASLISELLENRNLPKRFYLAAMNCLRDMHKSVSDEHQEILLATEFSPTYIEKLFEFTRMTKILLKFQMPAN